MIKIKDIDTMFKKIQISDRTYIRIGGLLMEIKLDFKRFYEIDEMSETDLDKNNEQHLPRETFIHNMKRLILLKILQSMYLALEDMITVKYLNSLKGENSITQRIKDLQEFFAKIIDQFMIELDYLPTGSKHIAHMREYLNKSKEYRDRNPYAFLEIPLDRVNLEQNLERQFRELYAEIRLRRDERERRAQLDRDERERLAQLRREERERLAQLHPEAAAPAAAPAAAQPLPELDELHRREEAALRRQEAARGDAPRRPDVGGADIIRRLNELYVPAQAQFGADIASARALRNRAAIENTDIETPVTNIATLNDPAQLRQRQDEYRQRYTDKAKCSICYVNEVNTIVLPCSHLFCSTCIDSWLITHRAAPRCPRCQGTIIHRYRINFQKKYLKYKNKYLKLKEKLN